MIHHCLHPRCALCGLQLEVNETFLCHYCSDYFPQISRCQRCGCPLEKQGICGQCLISPPPWDKLYCIDDYRFPLNHFIAQLKHHHASHYAAPLADLLVKRIDTPAPVLIPVPLHWRRQWKRGFNQSMLLAQRLAHHDNSCHVVNAFARPIATAPQQSLSKEQRVHNLDHAFCLKKSICARHVAIVDDVVTTGSTVSALVRQLRHQHIEKIDIYCLARTTLDNA